MRSSHIVRPLGTESLILRSIPQWSIMQNLSFYLKCFRRFRQPQQTYLRTWERPTNTFYLEKSLNNSQNNIIYIKLQKSFIIIIALILVPRPILFKYLFPDMGPYRIRSVISGVKSAFLILTFISCWLVCRDRRPICYCWSIFWAVMSLWYPFVFCPYRHSKHFSLNSNRVCIFSL